VRTTAKRQSGRARPKVKKTLLFLGQLGLKRKAAQIARYVRHRFKGATGFKRATSVSRQVSGQCQTLPGAPVSMAIGQLPILTESTFQNKILAVKF